MNNSENSSTPTGTKSITSNGTYDVSSYASVNVNVPVSTDTKAEYYIEAVENLMQFSVTSVITATQGWGSCNISINKTGYDAYVFVAKQTRDAYDMKWHVTGAGTNVKDLKVLKVSDNYSRCIVIVDDKTKAFTLKGTGYNGDTSSSQATVSFSMVPYNLS